MNKRQSALSRQVPEVPCMLLPLVNDVLLAPTVSIAEMASMRSLDKVDDTPEWFMGFFPWRGLNVPTLSFESINGRDLPIQTPNSRVAVLNNTGVNAQLPFIGVLAQTIPRMARIEEVDIVEDESRERRDFDLMAVKVGSESYTIPNISALEKAFLNLGLSVS